MSRLSNVRPRYLTTGFVGIKLLLNETGGHNYNYNKKYLFFEILIDFEIMTMDLSIDCCLTNI